MYQVSDAYKLKMMDQVQTHRLKGTLDTTINFTDSDVIGVSYSNQCSEKKVNVGSVFIGTLKLTFLQDYLNRGGYFGKVITISDGLLLGYDENENPIWEDVPIGSFYIADAVYRAEGMVDITAYDCLSKMDKTWQSTQATGTIYSFCKYIETMTGTTFGMTEEECQALPNGTESIIPYVDNEINTYRDLLCAIVQFAGGFATAERDGSWVIRNFKTTQSVNVPKNRRLQKASYSDYKTFFDGIAYTDCVSGEERVLGSATASIVELGPNPFMQYGTVVVKTRRCANILNTVAAVRYTPFNVGVLPAFIALDLGDVVRFIDDYTGGYTQGAVMSLTWTYNKTVQLQCFGENPNLATVQSQSRKSISSLRQTTAQNEISYFHYTNLEDIRFGSEVETLVARLRFISTQTTTVKIFHEFLMDMVANLSKDCSYEVRYYLDNELVSYSPFERLKAYGASNGNTDLSITRDFFYIIQNVVPNISHLWEVKIITHNVSSTEIDANHLHVTLEGQRMYADNLAGIMELGDNINLIDIGGFALIGMEDEVVFRFNPVTEYLLAENGDNLCTEAGDQFILE